MLNAYTIVFAALLVPAGRLADRAGRKRGFLLGVALFTVASTGSAAAGNVGMLVAFCAFMGVGAALLIPTSLSLVLSAFPPEQRGGAVRTWAAMGGLAAGLGPVLGGPLVSADWRWAFLINVPVGLLALAAGWRWLPDTPGEGGPVPAWCPSWSSRWRDDEPAGAAGAGRDPAPRPRRVPAGGTTRR